MKLCNDELTECISVDLVASPWTDAIEVADVLPILAAITALFATAYVIRYLRRMIGG